MFTSSNVTGFLLSVSHLKSQENRLTAKENNGHLTIPHLTHKTVLQFCSLFIPTANSCDVMIYNKHTKACLFCFSLSVLSSLVIQPFQQRRVPLKSPIKYLSSISVLVSDVPFCFLKKIRKTKKILLWNLKEPQRLYAPSTYSVGEESGTERGGVTKPRPYGWQVTGWQTEAGIWVLQEAYPGSPTFQVAGPRPS